VTPQLFLDLDGVLADFDAGVEALLGMSASDYEQKKSKRDFWFRLMRADNFYGSLPEMTDARLLFDAVAHLDPIILTGLPIGRWAAPQKERWVAEHFPGTPVITTMARDKHKHMKAGDMMVDDRENHTSNYQDAGMIIDYKKNAPNRLAAPRAIFPSIELPA